MKQVLVVSGSGLATANAVRTELIKALSDRGVKAVITAVDFKEFEDKVKKADLVVSTMFIDQKNHAVPIFNGMPFLTGVREGDEIEKLVSALEN